MFTGKRQLDSANNERDVSEMLTWLVRLSVKVMNVHRFGISFIGVLAGVSIWTSPAGILVAQEAEGEARNEVKESKATAISSKVSPSLTKVVNLVESGVGEEVLLAYVRNSTVSKPNADEIVYLHEAGVPTPVITALLSKNGISNSSPSSETGDSGPILAKPVYAQTPSAPASVVNVERAPTYVQPQPTVVYVPSYAPQYYSYPSYPGYYAGPAISLGFSFGGHHGFGHHFFGHHQGGHHFFGGHHLGGHHGGHHSFGHAGHHGGGHHSGRHR